MDNITTADQYLDASGLARVWDAVLDVSATIYECSGDFITSSNLSDEELVLTSSDSTVGSKIRMGDAIIVTLNRQSNVLPGVHGDISSPVSVDDSPSGYLSNGPIFTGCVNGKISGQFLLICTKSGSMNTFQYVPLPSRSSYNTLKLENSEAFGSDLSLQVESVVDSTKLLPIVVLDDIPAGHHYLGYNFALTNLLTVDYDIPAHSVIELLIATPAPMIADYGSVKTQVTQILTSGIKIATVSGTDIYAPEGGGSGDINSISISTIDTICS